MFVGAGFFTFVGVVAGIGLTAADGLAVAATGDFIAALVTPVLGEAVAARAGCVAGAVPVVAVEGATPLAAELLALLPPVMAFPDKEAKLVPGVRVGKFRL